MSTSLHCVLESFMVNTKETVGEIKELVQTFLRYTSYRVGSSGTAGAKAKPKKRKLNSGKDSHDVKYEEKESDTDSA